MAGSTNAETAGSGDLQGVLSGLDNRAKNLSELERQQAALLASDVVPAPNRR